MQIYGMHLSTVDDPGRVTQAIFLAGCECGCFYCQNRGRDEVTVSLQQIIGELKENAALIDSITFSGGEPLLSAGDILRIIEEIRSDQNLKYLELCIETSGTVHSPQVIDIFDKLDRIFLDIKADLSNCDCWERRGFSRDQYESVLRNVDEALRRMTDKHIEFRFTIYPDYKTEEIINSVKYILRLMQVVSEKRKGVGGAYVTFRLIRCNCAGQLSLKDLSVIRKRILEECDGAIVRI